MTYSRSAIENATTPEELQAILSAAGPSPRWMASSLAEVGQFFGMATSSIKNWRSDGMPGSDAGWPLDAIVRWRIDRLGNTDLTTVRKQQEIELNAIEIDARRLELSKDRGELVELAEVELWASVALVECREQIMSIPEAIATSAPPELRNHAREEADRTCRAALKSLHRRLELAQLDQEPNTTGVVADDDGEALKQ